MKYRIKRKIGYVLVVAMLVVMIYPGELSAASGQEDGFVIKGTTLQGYVGAENAVVIPDNITKMMMYSSIRRSHRWRSRTV